MSEPVQIAVIIEGGMVQGVLTAGVPVQFVVVDYDAEDDEANDVFNILQEDGSTLPAAIWSGDAERAQGDFIARTIRLTEEG